MGSYQVSALTYNPNPIPYIETGGDLELYKGYMYWVLPPPGNRLYYENYDTQYFW